MANSDRNRNWLALYKDAVSEKDIRKARTRITQAQAAISRRARELWYGGANDTSERHQMDAAAHFLGILRSMGEEKW